MELRKVEKNGYFKRKQSSSVVYVKGHYDRSTKSFSCSPFDDMNKEFFLKAFTKVFVDFEF